eukprot:Phypoly_transcript_16199.p1 GENE.Phypoly_transcript_16199~~Phypoly_transcript_16199.p1  ORF type:complete len:226 (+),score=50.34 Phypoly_transcript_16199:158-835(+)
MQSFVRVSRSTHTALRSLIQANSNSNSNPSSSLPSNSPTHSPITHKNTNYNKTRHHPSSRKFQDESDSGFLSPTTFCNTSKLLEDYNFNTSTKKHMMIGLGCEILIQLCAEALFFEQIPHTLVTGTLGMVQGSSPVQRRLGRHIHLKGDKYGLWVDEEDSLEGEKKTIMAHYTVEGERGCAKVVMQVEQANAHAEKKLVLLLSEFTNGDKFVIFELDEKPQPPAM